MEVTMLQKELSRFGWRALARVVALMFVLLQSVVFNASIYAVSPIPVTTNAAGPLVAPSAEVATEWFDLYLQLAKTTPGFTPPVASRAFGYAGVALYETVVPGFPEYQSLMGQLNELAVLPRPAAHLAFDWPTAANATLAGMARKRYANTSPENLATIDALETKWRAAALSQFDPKLVERSAFYGQSVAEAIFAWSRSDGGHEGYLHNFPAGYKLVEGVSKWLPTPAQFQPALQPYWGENRPFVLTNGAACPSAPPLIYSEAPASRFYKEGLEVYTTVQAASEEERAIAIFWADDPGETATPPGHSISLVTQVLRQENASLILAAEAYAKVGIAVADAFIGCWRAKYEYNLLRPVTYLQKLIDPQWMPLLNTPPFPEYPSGHSVQTGAVATVLADLFGEEYMLVDHTHDERGLAPRTFTSFQALAEEAALSRLYGGIHYRRAIEKGLEQGQCIGDKVNGLAFRR
jgi:hypothetical protein